MGCATSVGAVVGADQEICVRAAFDKLSADLTKSKANAESANGKSRSSLDSPRGKQRSSQKSQTETAIAKPQLAASECSGKATPSPSRAPSMRSLISQSSAYTIKEQIGEGAFGTVRSAIEDDTQQERAIKFLPLVQKGSTSKALDQLLLEEAEKEASVWSQVTQHPNVVELLGYYMEGEWYCFIMDRCTGGTLADTKKVFWQFPEWRVASVFKGMLIGVQHVHSCGVAHRDIKPTNFLLGGPDGKTVKLADFGLATMLPKYGRVFGTYGTPPYMSPEMAGKKGHNASTDLWSLGASCYLLFMGHYPYAVAPGQNFRSKGDAFKESIAKNIAPPTFVRVNPVVKESEQHLSCIDQPTGASVTFLKSLLTRDAQERSTSEQALDHTFLDEDYLGSCSEGRISATADRILLLTV